ncbi:MAG: hypothetical protein JRG73_09040 [Deltaproteobacteria bacterium]|nr:hypothetical protein [Deltaproteobacteria bacterium]MBW2307066.1 hypothetical protein [Deltaproteobacteria bacterium]
MRKFLAICMVAAMAVSFSTVAHATLFPDLLSANIFAKKLDFDGVTTLNDLTISQLTPWASGDQIEINFDICPKQKGLGSEDRIFYELPYTVDWSGVTFAPSSIVLASTVTNVFTGATGWGPTGLVLTLDGLTHTALTGTPGDGARMTLTLAEGSAVTIKGIRIIRNMFPCRPNNLVKLSVLPAEGFLPSTTISKYISRFDTSPGTNVLDSDPTKEDGLYWCNERFYHPFGVIAAACTDPCATWLKFGFVLGTADFVTVLVVTSDLSTTCNDGVADSVEFYAWDDFGTFLGTADVPVGGDFLLNSGQKSGQALMVIGVPAFTWNGGNTWDALNPGGIGSVIAKALQPFAHGVAIILGPGGMSTYVALQDPSITGVDSAGGILREDYYNFKEPYLGYFIGAPL